MSLAALLPHNSTPLERAHSSTFCRLRALVFALPARTRETVLIDTPAWRAISWIFSLPPICRSPFHGKICMHD